MTALDEIRAAHGDCVAGSILLSREEYDRCATPAARADLLRAKVENAATSLLRLATERWGER